jgi:hypothetical protein
MQRAIGISVLVFLAVPGYAATVFQSTFNWTDTASGGSVQIQVQVLDNLAGNFSKYAWNYMVTNLSYNPTPGTTNGLSGFTLLFPFAIPELADQFAPSGWILNCCGIAPPGGVGWDLPNSSGSGIPVGGSALFGFSTMPRPVKQEPGIAPFITSFAYSYNSDLPVNLFTGPLAVPTVPEPLTFLLSGTGLALLALKRYISSSPTEH